MGGISSAQFWLALYSAEISRVWIKKRRRIGRGRKFFFFLFERPGNKVSSSSNLGLSFPLFFSSSPPNKTQPYTPTQTEEKV